MNARIRVACLSLVALSAACSSTVVGGGGDASVVCDGDVCTTIGPDGTTVLPDGQIIGPDATVEGDSGGPGTDVVIDNYVPGCGSGRLDPGEQCDDGNRVNGDGCDMSCRWEPRCGDGRRDPMEVCDDGNNRSGDGCRSDCLSNEMCGNMIVDTTVGELCDPPGPTCSMNCRTITTCGNGRIDMGEQCDDGNTTRWDGCAPDCKTEQGIVFDAFYIGNERAGCDFTGDGMVDNTFSRALGPATGVLNTAINNGVSNGTLLLQLAFLSLDDRTGVIDPDLRVGWLTGADGDMDPLNNRDPGTRLRVQTAGLNMMGLPTANYQSAILMTQLSGGPEDILLDLPGPMGMPFSFRVQRSRIRGQLMTDGMRILGLQEGVLCGGIPTRDLAGVPNFFQFLGSIGPGGGGMTGTPRSSLLEALVGGFRAMIPLFGTIGVGPAQPDVDLDNDGLERIEATAGDLRTPPQITACIDGNGTRIPGRTCVMDPRMADGFTAGFRMNGVWFNFAGTAAGGRPMP